MHRSSQSHCWGVFCARDPQPERATGQSVAYCVEILTIGVCSNSFCASISHNNGCTYLGTWCNYSSSSPRDQGGGLLTHRYGSLLICSHFIDQQSKHKESNLNGQFLFQGLNASLILNYLVYCQQDKRDHQDGSLSAPTATPISVDLHSSDIKCLLLGWGMYLRPKHV